MSSYSSTTSTSSAAGYPYLLPPNLYVTEAAGPEADLAAQPWMMATVIEDDDLMFGGKSLSAWYEEERLRQSATASSTATGNSADSSRHNSDAEDEAQEELRGRQRVRSSHRSGGHKKESRKQ
jgi:hypothetical protein